MIIDLPDGASMTLSAVLGAGCGYWVYRCARFFATWFWIKRYFPTFTEADRNPSEKFVQVFRIIGLVGIWGYAFSLAIYWILRISGAGVVSLKTPAI